MREKPPQYSVPKGKTRSYLDNVVKLAKRSPSPVDHHTELKWIKKQAINQGKGSDRVMIIDKIMKYQKQFPSPNTYRVNYQDKVPLGKLNKTQGIGFMSESEYLGKTLPAPNKYEPNESLVTKKTLGFKILKPKMKLSWKPIKVKDPDVGSYEHQLSILKTSKLQRVTSAVFDKQKRTQIGKTKSKVPGVGTYKLENVYDKIFRPMKSSRR